MFRGYYNYKNPHLKEWIKEQARVFWRYFSLIIIPLGMTLYSPIATWIDRMKGFTTGNGFWEDMKEYHLPSLLFGITFLIAFDIGFFSVDRHDIKRWGKVYVAGRTRVYTPEEVDAQANAPESEWLPNLRIILAPEIIIGYNNGVMVARYEDIECLKVRSTIGRVQLSFFKWVDRDSIRLHPSGKGVNELVLSETFEDPELVRMEIDIVREKCQQLQPEKNIKIVKIDDRAGIIRERERRDAQKAKEKGKAQKAKDRRKGNTSGKRTGRQNQKPSGRR